MKLYEKLSSVNYTNEYKNTFIFAFIESLIRDSNVHQEPENLLHLELNRLNGDEAFTKRRGNAISSFLRKMNLII